MKTPRLLLVISLILGTISFSYAKPASTPGQGTGLDRTSAALAMHQFNLGRRGQALTSLQPRPLKDQGNVSVLQDDGTLIMPLNRFDLANRSLTFSPQGEGYQLQAAAGAFDNGQGGQSNLTLGDDDSVPVALPFSFRFYGVNYSTVFVNTDGNLTFGQGDASVERNLRHVIQGAPRIAPILDDFLPSGIGRVAVEKLSDRVIIDWLSISEYGFRSRSSFQVVLRSTGVIQFNYQTMSISGGVVALSPGNGAALQPIDMSLQTVAGPVSGVVAEVFSNIEQLDLAAISSAFYDRHQDAYDALIVFSDFSLDLQDAFAYEIPVRNDIQGIMPEGVFDFSAGFGSPGRLSSMVNGGALSQYPNDPQEVFLGTNNTIDILGQEFGHRWLAFVDTDPSSMLGRDLAHWSFFMNTEGSVMEGNQILDLGNGLFRTGRGTFRYSPLDQYIMGLRSPAEVSPWFVVTNPRLVSAPADFDCFPINAACGPAEGVELSGTRRNLTINDVIAMAGPRVPDSTTAQKNFTAAFIVITKSGQEANATSVAHVDTIRQQWEQFFVGAVDGRGTMSTTLVYPPVTRLDLDIPSNGSTFQETAATGSLHVGYGVLRSAVGAAVLRSFSGSDLVSEAAVPASTTASHWIMYAEKAAKLSTGVAIANPSATAANLILSLNDGRQTTLQIPAGGQHAAFVEELFGGLENFLGTLTIQSNVDIAVLALRGSQNVSGDFIMSTIPLSSAAPETGGITAFPMTADGGGYNTEMILVNAGNAPSIGTVRFSSGTPAPFSIVPGGVWKFQTPGNAAAVAAGSATVNVESGPMPDATAVIRFSSAAGLISETGIPAQHLLSNGLMFGSLGANLRTGVAILNPSTQPVQIHLTARDAAGLTVGLPGTITLDGSGRTSAFLDEFLSGIPQDFDGTVAMEASSPVYAISLRGTTVGSGFLMAATPIFDTFKAVPAVSYFPHIAMGGVGAAFTTEFLIGTAGPTSAQVDFFGPTGAPLPVLLQ